MKSFILFLLFPICALAGFPVKATRTIPNHWLICHGDSITLGSSLTTPETQRYSNVVTTSVASAKGYIFGELNRGINGQGLNYVYTSYDSVTGLTSGLLGTLTSDAVGHIDPLLTKPNARLVIFAGTNDIFLNGTSGSAAWTLLQTYINARISAGWAAASICVCTMLPRQGSHESDRTSLNSSIRSNAAGMGYVIADLAADPNIGVAGADSNTTYYYSNQIHPTAAGQSIIAGIIQAALYP